jgi:hypothetical protein
MDLEKINELLMQFMLVLMPPDDSENFDQVGLRETIEMRYRSERVRLTSGSSEYFDCIIPSSGFEQGLNTFGILLDRLTILNIKLFLLKRNNQKDKNLVDQIQGLLSVISVCKPTLAHILEKEIKNDLEGLCHSPFENLLELQKSNLIQWLNQDLLYTVDPLTSPCLRLRAYVIQTREDNRMRNRMIEALDRWFLNRAKL